jgi:uncharacterized membrane protein
VAGATLIAIVYAAGAFLAGSGFIVLFKPVLIIILSGVVGNIFDSILGTTWERQQYIGNNAVNFLNTAMAALCAWLLDCSFFLHFF